MKKIIHCPHCNRQMSVDSKFAGRKLNCPVCGNEMEIPNFDQDEASVSEPKSEESTASDPGSKSDEASKELAADVQSNDLSTLDWKRLEFPKVESDDPMLKFFPEFRPNPFAVSYPLNVKNESDGADDNGDEDDEFVNSKMPSVDELINEATS